MIRFTRRALLAAAATLPLMAEAASAEGLISIIVTDPANQWKEWPGMEPLKEKAHALGLFRTNKTTVRQLMPLTSSGSCGPLCHEYGPCKSILAKR